MKLRFIDESGTEFVLLDPSYAESAIFGPTLTVESYYLVSKRKRYFVAFPGSFRVRDCIACEPIFENERLPVAV